MTADVPDADRPPARTYRLLVVDDDPLSRSLQSRLLGLLGHRALATSAPEEALETALGGDIDGMLLDLGMPRIDGFTLLQQLRERERALGRRPLPVIAVTGYAAASDRLRCLMAGFNDHLSKPIDIAALDAALLRHLPPQAGGGDGPVSDAQRVEATAKRLAQAKPSDRGFAPTLLEAFAMRSGQLIEEASRAFARGDAPAAAEAVKTLRASADFMGATGLVGLCERLQAAPPTDAALCAALMHELEEEHQSVLVLLLQSARGTAPPP